MGVIKGILWFILICIAIPVGLVLLGAIYAAGYAILGIFLAACIAMAVMELFSLRN
jgi:hypothetical protein